MIKRLENTGDISEIATLMIENDEFMAVVNDIKPDRFETFEELLRENVKDFHMYIFKQPIMPLKLNDLTEVVKSKLNKGGANG